MFTIRLEYLILGIFITVLIYNYYKSKQEQEYEDDDE